MMTLKKRQWIDEEALQARCSDTEVDAGASALASAISGLIPDGEAHAVLTRGNWYRLGGVVDADLQPVSDNILQWVEEESGGDVDALVARYADADYYATRLAGKTHYLTIEQGRGATDFVQLEIEELQEVVDRPLVAADWFPDTLEEFLDPLDLERADPQPVSKGYYRFRRLTDIPALLNQRGQEQRTEQSLRRFLDDWQQSSAAEGRHFCRHWVLSQRAYIDRDGEERVSIKPVSTFTGALPELPSGEVLSGSKLANAIHSFDHRLGYPFAWYFMMLSSKASNVALADAVLRDQLGAYDYLPSRDLKVLRGWEERPYAV